MSETTNKFNDTVSLKEFFDARLIEQHRYFEARFGDQERRFRELSEAIGKLTGAIIGREVFDELSKDVAEHDENIKNLDIRLTKIEGSANFLKYAILAAWAILAPIIINWISKFL